jgi:hypothetical protein
MSKHKTMQGYRRKMRGALKAAGADVPPRIGHGKQTGWKKEVNRKAFAPARSQQQIDVDIENEGYCS